MPERTHYWPPGHWDWLIHLSFKHGCRCGKMIYVGGQVDKDIKGKCLNLYDLKAQTETVMRHIRTVLAGFGAAQRDVVKLVAFYVNDGTVDEAQFVAHVAAQLPSGARPAITAVPLPWLAYPGMLVEIEPVAMLGEDGAVLPKACAEPAGLRSPGAANLAHAVRCANMIHTGAQSARDAQGRVLHPGDIVRQSEVAMDNLAKVLGAFGASLDDAVKLNVWYAGQGTTKDWQEAALACARHFKEPGPVATFLPVPWLPDGEMIRMEVVAMRGEDGTRLPRAHARPKGHGDWPVLLPFQHGLKCADMVFVGGQVALDPQGTVRDPGDLLTQTVTAMDNVAAVLNGFGLGLDDVVKNNAFYKGEAGPDTIVANQRIRSARYTEPGPASTGVPLKHLAMEGLMTTIEVIAMTR